MLSGMPSGNAACALCNRWVNVLSDMLMDLDAALAFLPFSSHNLNVSIIISLLNGGVGIVYTPSALPSNSLLT